uniref:Uncharacterized protein n=1 Tax=Anguilla anguilla TaxID=7936 RepID=A0A0E9PYV2_ANGAN
MLLLSLDCHQRRNQMILLCFP